MEFKDSEQGSLAPLGIGLASLSLAAVVAIVSAGSLYLTERRLTSVAEATALSVLASIDELDNLHVLADAFLSTHPLNGLTKVRLIEAASRDSKTVLIRLCSSWEPLIPGYIFSETGTVCSEGLARRGR